MGTPEEERQLADLRFSVVEWGLADIKRAATVAVGLPRLAFVGLKDWIDQVSRLYSGKRYEPSWQEYIGRYLPQRSAADVSLLYKGLRNPLTHEYGTNGVALMDNSPDEHWKDVDGIRLVDLGSLIAEFEGAFERFYADLENDADLRREVLPRTLGLLKPVNFEGAVAASASSTAIVAMAASATAGPDISMYRVEEVPEMADGTLAVVAGELVEGKRTFIERGGAEFELPDQHTAEWTERDGARCIYLSTPQMGGAYYVIGVDEDEERVVVHVGDYVDGHGPGTSGDQVPEIGGYPFP